MITLKKKNKNMTTLMKNPEIFKIVEHLYKNGKMYTGEIIKELSLSQRKGLRYIMDLKKLGVLQTSPDSAKLMINPAKMEMVKSFLQK